MIPIFRGSENPGLELKKLIEDNEILVAPGVFNPISAMIAEKVGFKSIYLSGAALTGSLGLPDLGLITLDELVYFVNEICSKVDIPLIVDADTGFGEVLNVARSVRMLEKAGAAALQIEDQVLPKKCGHLSGKILVSLDDMVRKIKYAVEARRNLLIVARTDARSVEGIDKALERARTYEKAGADIIFPEALLSEDEFKEFSKKISVPLLANMTEFGKTPYYTVDQFKNWGYKIVIFPATSFRGAVKTMEKVYKEIWEKGTQKYILDILSTRNRIYELIEYWKYENLDNKIFGETK